MIRKFIGPQKGKLNSLSDIISAHTMELLEMLYLRDLTIVVKIWENQPSWAMHPYCLVHGPVTLSILLS